MGKFFGKYRWILARLCIVFVMYMTAPNNGGALTAQENTSPAQENTPPSITFCYQDKELFPNYMGEQNTKPVRNPGINIELVDQIALNLNLEVQYVRYSWNRCLALLKVGRVDSLIASYNSDRAEIGIFPMAGNSSDASKRISTLGYYMYHTSDLPVWDGEGLVDPKTVVAAPLGYSVVRALREKGIKVIETGSPEDNLKLLVYRRVDAIAAPGTTVDALISADITRYNDIKKDPIPITERPYFIAFSHKFFDANPSLAKAIWQQTSNVRTALRQQLVDKYYNQ